MLQNRTAMTQDLPPPLPAPPPGRIPPRKRKRVKFEENAAFNADILAPFKSTPLILPKDIQTVRPFTGMCCECLPQSKKSMTVDLSHQNGLRNVFNLKPYLIYSGWIHRHFPIFSYSFFRQHHHQYPDVSMAVLGSNRLLEAIQKSSIISFSKEFHNGRHNDIQSLQYVIVKNVKKTLKKMKAAISGRMIRFTVWFFHSFFTMFLKNILVHRGQMLMLQEASKKNLPMIILPLHRSHLDYLLIPFALWHYEIRIPYVAAGDNLNMPVFSKLISACGGFLIRRRLDRTPGEKDVIYRTLLHVYFEELLKHGQIVEFFIEGGRTRSGKTTLPKGGLLSIVVEAYVTGQIPDALIVPVSVNYDKLIDGNFCREQMGLPKVSESFWRAIKGIFNMFVTDHGSARMDFCQPFSLKEFIERHKDNQHDDSIDVMSSSVDLSPDSATNLLASYPNLNNPLCASSEVDRQLVRDLAVHSVYTATESTALMSTNLVCFLLLTKFRNGTNLSELSKSLEHLAKEIREHGRDLGFCGTMTDAVHNAVGLLGKKLIQVKLDSKSDENVLIQPNLRLPQVYELMYYSNSVLSVYLLESIVASAIVYVVKNASNNLGIYSTPEISKEDILDTAQEICSILSYEFIFVPPCKELAKELAEVLEKFINFEVLYQEQESGDMYSDRDMQWSKNLSAALSWDDDEDVDDYDFVAPAEIKYKVNLKRDDIQTRMKFLLTVIAPTFEAYYTTTNFIDVALKTEMAEDDFIKQLNQFAKSEVAASKLTYNESSAMHSLKICVKAFTKLGILDSYSASNIKLLGLNDDFDIKNRLVHIMKLLESVKL